MTDTPTETTPAEETPTAHTKTTSTVIGYAGRTSTTITRCNCGNPWPCPNHEETPE